MTEGWCYGTMSVFAPRKGHYCHRGLWEMTPDVLLLFLALTACLTEPVRCEDDDGSGVQDKAAEQLLSVTTIHTPAVTDVSDSPITVHNQEDEVSGVAETLAQVTSEKNSTIRRIFNETDTKAHNVTTVEVKHDKGRKLPNDVTSGDMEDHQEEDEKTDKPPEQEEKDDQETYIIVAASLTLALLLVAAVVGLLYLCRRRRGKSTPDPEKDDPYLDDDYEEKVPMPMFEDDMPSVMELEMEDFEKWMIKGGGDISAESKQRHPS